MQHLMSTVARKSCIRTLSMKHPVETLKPSLFPERQATEDSNVADLPDLPEISDDLIDHLEHLSLVRFSNESAVLHLKKAMEYANRLHVVNTDDVHPMYSVLEDKMLQLRADEVTETNCRSDILRNATKTVEEYFVAPPGNIPLEPRTDKIDSKEMKRLSKERRKV